MSTTKKKKDYRPTYDGKFMTLKIPTALHTNIKIDAIKRTDINLDQLVIEYLSLGYKAHHNGYQGKVNG